MKHAVRTAEHDPDYIQIHEVFHTLQGEGPYAGTPAWFIRLSGCNLRCWFCDTSWDDEKDRRYAYIDFFPGGEIFEHLRGNYLKTDLVVITGGEPFRQNMDKMIAGLTMHFSKVQIETAGTLPPAHPVNMATWMRVGLVDIVVSPKTPKVHAFFTDNPCHWKYIIKEGEQADDDGLPIRSTQSKGTASWLCRPPANAKSVSVQPCEEESTKATARNTRAAMCTALEHGYRLSLQQHKILGLS